MKSHSFRKSLHCTLWSTSDLAPGIGLQLLFYKLMSTEGMGDCRDLTEIVVLQKPPVIGDLPETLLFFCKDIREF